MHPSADTIIDEAGQHRAADRGELVPRRPGVRVGPITRQVPIEIIRQRLAAEGELLVIGAIRRRRHPLREARTRPAPRDPGSIARRVVRIPQVAERRRRQLVRQRREPRGGVVTVLRCHPAG